MSSFYYDSAPLGPSNRSHAEPDPLTPEELAEFCRGLGYEVFRLPGGSDWPGRGLIRREPGEDDIKFFVELSPCADGGWLLRASDSELGYFHIQANRYEQTPTWELGNPRADAEAHRLSRALAAHFAGLYAAKHRAVAEPTTMPAALGRRRTG